MRLMEFMGGLIVVESMASFVSVSVDFHPFLL